METKVILKYRRECDKWVCPECDAENNMTVARCTVCDSARTASATFLRQWSPADEAPVAPPTPTHTAPTYTGYRTPEPYRGIDDPRYMPPAEKENSGAVWAIVAVVAVILLIFIACVANAAEPTVADATECACAVCEEIEATREADWISFEHSGLKE